MDKEILVVGDVRQLEKLIEAGQVTLEDARKIVEAWCSDACANIINFFPPEAARLISGEA